MRKLGLGLKGANKFCGLMDMPAFLSQSTYDMIIQNIHSCVEIATGKLLDNARNQEKQLTSTNKGEAHSI